jgi:hypothetical protein
MTAPQACHPLPGARHFPGTFWGIGVLSSGDPVIRCQALLSMWSKKGARHKVGVGGCKFLELMDLGNGEDVRFMLEKA